MTKTEEYNSNLHVLFYCSETIRNLTQQRNESFPPKRLFRVSIGNVLMHNIVTNMNFNQAQLKRRFFIGDFPHQMENNYFPFRIASTTIAHIHNSILKQFMPPIPTQFVSILSIQRRLTVDKFIIQTKSDLKQDIGIHTWVCDR